MEIPHNPDAPVSASDDLWTGMRVQEFLLTKGGLSEHEMSSHHLTVNIGTAGYAHHKERGVWNTTRYDFGAVGFIPANQASEPKWNFNSRIMTIEVQEDTGYKANYVAKRGIVDRDITQIALILSRELQFANGASILLGDMAAIALKNLLADRYDSSVFKKRAIYTGLTGTQLARVIDYCKANLSENISLSELASLCSLSPFHFLRQFKKSSGMSPFQFFSEIKIDEAKQKLISTDTPINALSYELGYVDQAHFSKIFKQHTGQSPRAYRIQGKRTLIAL